MQVTAASPALAELRATARTLERRRSSSAGGRSPRCSRPAAARSRRPPRASASTRRRCTGAACGPPSRAASSTRRTAIRARRPERYVDALSAAAVDPRAAGAARRPGSRRASSCRSAAPSRSSSRSTGAALDGLLARPGHVGWRAVAELEDWRATEVYANAERTPDAYDDEVVRRMGCARGVRIAGPFGHGGRRGSDALVRRRRSPGRGLSRGRPTRCAGPTPHVLSVTQTRCLAEADEQVQDGVFYVESFFTTRGDRELIVAVQGAVAVWIDGVQVALARPGGVGLVAALRRARLGARRAAPRRGARADARRRACGSSSPTERRPASTPTATPARPRRSFPRASSADPEPDRRVRARRGRRGARVDRGRSRRVGAGRVRRARRPDGRRGLGAHRARSSSRRTRRRSRWRWRRRSCRPTRPFPRTRGHPRARALRSRALAARPVALARAA